MLIKSVKTFVVAVACFLSVNSFAGLITDIEDFGSNNLVANKASFSWTHNILDQGFVLGSAESASILIAFRDDDDKQPENMHIFFDLEKVSAADAKPTTNWFHNLQFSSLVQLNADGLLVVTVKSVVGDFFIDRSTLNVVTRDISVSVPESSSLLLFGLGLLGLGVMRRKTRA